MTNSKLKRSFVFAGTVAFVVASYVAPFQNQTDFEEKYRSHFEVPYNQDLPGHAYPYEHPSTITMVASGSFAPSSGYGFPGILPEVFKLE